MEAGLTHGKLAGGVHDLELEFVGAGLLLGRAWKFGP
jgi:hypothetical protein